MLASVAVAVVLACLAVFQIALACGAPLGRYAFGGRHERELPRSLRVASAVTVLLYAALAAVVLDRGGTIDVLPAGTSRIGAWVAVAIFALGALPNAASRSRHERYVMTPTTVVLAILSLVVALGPAGD
ncbi:hypothetical protein [Patulibacter americanus]|uniref:hypothetical protein n=1 Tax=Patulibacter americanus TaxID=588672 RepID=UPI0003B3B457|nr:hypothetical protein [Patulibacter americanus]